MTVTVLGEPYKVPKAAGSAVNIQLGVNDWKIFKRHKHEADAALQARIHEWLANERAVRTPDTAICVVRTLTRTESHRANCRNC
jgi:hypothetical protein